MQQTPSLVLTIGHSTHPIEDFLALLHAHQVEQLIDVRTIPKSLRNPQFGSKALEASLSQQAIGYVHLPSLGGLRHSRKDSTNLGWKNASFRGYADYMQTPAFEDGLTTLTAIASEHRTVIMCAEAMPWRCHRSLIADALVVRGIAVEHIFSATHRKPHKLTGFAKVDGIHVAYPGLDFG